MDLINEFGFLLSNNTPSEFDVLVPPNSKLRKLYDLIIHENVNTDDTASSIIYNSHRSDKKYLMLKRNLVQKLSDLVFLQDYYETVDENYKTIQFQVEKELVIAEKLILKNVYHNPTKIISKVESTAEKYYLIDSQVHAAKIFRSVYALKGFPQETDEYDLKVQQLSMYQQYLTSACGLWEKIYARTKFSLAKTEKLKSEAMKACKVVAEWCEIYASPFLKLYLYRIELIKNNQINNWKEFAEELFKLKKLIEDYPYINSKGIQLELNFGFALYYRNIREISKAENYINKCLIISDYRAFDKFLIQELNFDIQLKKENYYGAGQIIEEVYRTPQYKLLNAFDKSAWGIREAYIFWLFEVFKLNSGANGALSITSKTNVKSLLEKTRKSTKDKYGYNIMLLIIRVLLYRLNNEKDIDNEGNNMLIYYHRYLKNINSKRTMVFFKYLSKSAAVSFNADEMENFYNKMVSELSETENNIYDALELIPYEDFWKAIMKA